MREEGKIRWSMREQSIYLSVDTRNAMNKEGMIKERKDKVVSEESVDAAYRKRDKERKKDRERKDERETKREKGK